MMWGWGNWWIGGVMMILFWGAVIALIVWAVRSGRSEGAGTHRPSPHDVLAERFARGEISADEYRERKQVLDQHRS